MAASASPASLSNHFVRAQFATSWVAGAIASCDIRGLRFQCLQAPKWAFQCGYLEANCTCAIVFDDLSRLCVSSSPAPIDVYVHFNSTPLFSVVLYAPGSCVNGFTYQNGLCISAVPPSSTGLLAYPMAIYVAIGITAVALCCLGGLYVWCVRLRAEEEAAVAAASAATASAAAATRAAVAAAAKPMPLSPLLVVGEMASLEQFGIAPSSAFNAQNVALVSASLVTVRDTRCVCVTALSDLCKYCIVLFIFSIPFSSTPI